MRGFAVWALWTALGLLVVDAGLEVGRGRRERERTQQQAVPTTGQVQASDGGDGTPPTPPPY